VAVIPRKAVFLDKDGTLIEDVPYNVVPARIRFMPNAERGLRRLSKSGFHLIVVSNQSGVARGFFRENELTAVERRIAEMFTECGVGVDGFYYCPHYIGGVVAAYAIECDCRKPRPGMLLRAAREQAIELRRSWLIGDILDDIEAGRRAGCRTVLLDNGHETEWRRSPLRTPDLTALDLADAAERIEAAETNQ
jgi:histidinol-phosphate phosphatase family protein